MLHASQIVLYALTIIIVLGIGFLLWTLIELLRESHRQSAPTAQTSEHFRLRR